MFILSFIAAIMIGYVLKGNIKNLSNADFKGAYLILGAFLIEFVINMAIIKGFISPNTITYSLIIIMYTLISIFVIINRKSPYLVLMGIGFIFNAVAIFANGGTMPVSQEAIQITNITDNINREGLYSMMGAQTNLKLLCDFIPVRFISSFVISVGDIISAVGMMLFIIINMKISSNTSNNPLKH